jgi:thiol-disulfide isomerase/thioredoxin
MAMSDKQPVSLLGSVQQRSVLIASGILFLALCGLAAADTPLPPGVTPEQAAAHQRQVQKEQEENPTLAIDSPLPPFDLPGVDGKKHSQDEYKSSSLLVVMFISNHCPASQIYESRIKQLVADFGKRGVAFVAIAPNGPAAVSPRELNYTDVDDSLKGMIERAHHGKYDFPYLYDGDTQAVSHRFGPKVTPHLFVFDKTRKLRYEGRIDNNLNEAKASTHEAREAIEALLQGKAVAVNHTPVFGCSTKWNGSSAASEEWETWRASPVDLQSASLKELPDLKKGQPGRLVMINFWATWCGPCQVEFPKLVETYLWYRSRGFDFVSVSVDNPTNRAAVLRFLKQQQAAVRNLQVDSDDLYAIQAAFDKTWESGVPYTLVIGEDGTPLYQKSGEVDLLRMRRIILANLPDVGLFAGNASYWKP